MSLKRTFQEERWMCDQVLEHLFQFISDTSDRAAISEVNKQWYRIEGLTRKKVAVKFMYAVCPTQLVQRFTSIEELTIKGRPRICDWGMLGSNWGGSVDPWIEQIVMFYSGLRSIHLRRVDISDCAISALAQAFSGSLQVLRLEKCTGFSTAGLLSIADNCRNLKVLSMDESIIKDSGGEWLHVLGQNCSQLEVLNFSLTGVEVKRIEDLQTVIKKNSKQLVSLRMDEVVTCDEDIVHNRRLLCGAHALKELLLLYRGKDDQTMVQEHLDLPSNLVSLAGDVKLPLDPSLASRLVKLDLMLATTLQESQSHQEIIESCPNLEELKVRNIIGDDGVDVVAKNCPKLKKIRIENLEDQHGFVSHKGLTSLAFSCISLQSVAIYTSDLDNTSLAAFGICCPHLENFRVAVLDSPTPLCELPLDTGVKKLLQGCKKLTKLALYLKTGGLSDKGLEEAGKLAYNLKWLLLGCAGYSDLGFLEFAKGCRELVKLELRHCPFSEGAIVTGVRKMPCLRYVWSQGYREEDPKAFILMGPGWNVEYTPSMEPTETQFVAYRTLAGPRYDCPPHTILLSVDK